MPRIVLKPNSPEYADQSTKPEEQRCEMPGCACAGEYKAPKHRGLNEYHHFCLEHIREYNRAWNFFSGMSADEVQNHMNDALYGYRPTWRYDNHRDLEDELRAKAWETKGASDENYAQDKSSQRSERASRSNFHGASPHSPEVEAMAIMGLEPPVELNKIKATYKKLAKKYHPDLNRGDKDAEEKLKKINMAYTILKMAYVEFEKLPERS